MTGTSLDRILRRLAEVARTGRLEGLTIEHWQGGGLPPPYYRSHQVRLLCLEGMDQVEVAVLVFDDKFDPPQLQEKWLMQIAPAAAAEAAAMLLESRALVQAFPEETRSGTADVMTHELVVTVDGRQAKRVYNRRPPAALDPFLGRLATLEAAARASGRHGFFHRGVAVVR